MGSSLASHRQVIHGVSSCFLSNTWRAFTRPGLPSEREDTEESQQPVATGWGEIGLTTSAQAGTSERVFKNKQESARQIAGYNTK